MSCATGNGSLRRQLRSVSRWRLSSFGIRLGLSRKVFEEDCWTWERVKLSEFKAKRYEHFLMACYYVSAFAKANDVECDAASELLELCFTSSCRGIWRHALLLCCKLELR